jgi:hypothetical protein
VGRCYPNFRVDEKAKREFNMYETAIGALSLSTEYTALYFKR